jgi:maltooligosyltrehalose synthase
MAAWAAAGDCRDTRPVLPDGLAARKWLNHFAQAEAISGPQLAVAEVLAQFPVGLLSALPA